MSLIGLCGAHRTGKTSLAEEFSAKKKCHFLATSVSQVFYDLGYDPGADYDFRTRLTIQEAVLEHVDALYAKAPTAVPSVCDRTPLDMLAYTLAEAYGDRVSAEDQDRLEAYTQKCIDITNKRFSLLLVIQPGIPLVYEPGKAALNKAYIEHLNSLILGLTVDERVDVSHFYLPRYMTDMDERMDAVSFAVGRVLKFAEADRKQIPNRCLH